jgi:hypothetical protein
MVSKQIITIFMIVVENSLQNSSIESWSTHCGSSRHGVESEP